MLLSKSLLIVAGAVGVASILAAVLISSPDIFAKRDPFVKVTIGNLKETYGVGEPVDFFIRIEGYGCDTGFPTVNIMKVGSNLTQGNSVWSRMGEIRSFPIGFSCELEDLYKVKHIGDVQKYNSDEQERMRTRGSMPIILKEGEYVVMVEEGIGPTITTKEFSVGATGAG